MKVVYVIDSISDFKQKINLIKNRFPCEILFVVRADLLPLVDTYGIKAHAIYYNNLTRIIHTLLINSSLSDVIICYASLKFNNQLLINFSNSIGDKSKIVCLKPNYNAFDRFNNAIYNVYVKSLFKIKDSLISPKLQFIPEEVLLQLLTSHLGNRLFEYPNEFIKNVYIDNPEINKTSKPKTDSLKIGLLSIIITLVLTASLLACIAYLTTNFIVITIFVLMYILNISLTIIFLCKTRFDQRFLK